jgi:hypothetical protein
MRHNGLRLCEGGEIEAQMFKLAQMLIRIPMLKFSTKAPLLQNRCYKLPFFRLGYIVQIYTSVSVWLSRHTLLQALV